MEHDNLTFMLELINVQDTRNKLLTTFFSYRLTIESTHYDGVTFKLPIIPKLNETSVLMVTSVKPKMRNGFPVGCYLSFIDDQIHGTFKHGKFEVVLVPAKKAKLTDAKQKEVEQLYRDAIKLAKNSD